MPDWSYNDHLYFGPDLRNIILKSGRSLTLLKITYDNATRLVEPYSLKFLESKEGIAREYLYVWDRTGSKNNPGIKRFLPDKIQFIENTEEVFTPRDGQDVELCKSGEYPPNRYLYDKDKKAAKEVGSYFGYKSPLLSRVASIGPKYSYKCSVCGKIFRRKERISVLNVHKNKNGHPCYGYPIYIGVKY